MCLFIKCSNWKPAWPSKYFKNIYQREKNLGVPAATKSKRKAMKRNKSLN